ncbi:hypothetical protein HK405_007443, partial [Cladochytrium tenue]
MEAAARLAAVMAAMAAPVGATSAPVGLASEAISAVAGSSKQMNGALAAPPVYPATAESGATASPASNYHNPMAAASPINNPASSFVVPSRDEAENGGAFLTSAASKGKVQLGAPVSHLPTPQAVSLPSTPIDLGALGSHVVSTPLPASHSDGSELPTMDVDDADITFVNDDSATPAAPNVPSKRSAEDAGFLTGKRSKSRNSSYPSRSIDLTGLPDDSRWLNGDALESVYVSLRQSGRFPACVRFVCDREIAMLRQEILAAREGKVYEKFSQVLATPPHDVLLLDYVNTEPQPKSGRHWQMVAARGDGQSYYACSLGWKMAAHAFSRVTEVLTLYADLAERLGMDHGGWAMPAVQVRINVPKQINGDCCGDLAILNSVLLASAALKSSIPTNPGLKYAIDKRLVREVRGWIIHVRGTVINATMPDGNDYVSNLVVALKEAGHGALADILSGQGDAVLVSLSKGGSAPKLAQVPTARRELPAGASIDKARSQFVSEDISRAILADGPLAKTRKVAVAGDLAEELPHGLLMSLEPHGCSHSRCDVDKACRAVGELMAKASKRTKA